MIQIFEELSKFDDIIYYDDPHVYYRNGKKMTSVTTLIGKFEKEFDEEYHSKRKAIQLGISQAEVLAMWKLKNLISTVKGSAVHSYIENYLAHKLFPYASESIALQFNGIDPVKEKFDKIIPLVHKFYDDIRGKLLPIKSELIVGDSDFDICGMIDQLFYNKKSGMLELWDWKTNEKIDTESKYKLLSPISHISQAKLDVYSLQLSLYKLIVQKNTNLKLGDSYLVWFNESNDSYKIYKCHDYQDEVKLMIDHFKSMKV